MTLIKRLMTGALIALAAVNAAHSAGLGVSRPDSVQATGAAPLAASACLNPDMDWVAAVPSGYFRAATDGYCYADTTCPYGVNAARNACNAGTLPTVSLSIPGAVYANSSFTATWSSSGAPMPTGVTIACYNSGWAQVASWNVSGASGSQSLGTTASMVGSLNCRASATNAVGTGYSGYVPMTVSCPPGTVFSGGSCVAAVPAQFVPLNGKTIYIRAANWSEYLSNALPAPFITGTSFLRVSGTSSSVTIQIGGLGAVYGPSFGQSCTLTAVGQTCYWDNSFSGFSWLTNRNCVTSMIKSGSVYSGYLAVPACAGLYSDPASPAGQAAAYCRGGGETAWATLQSDGGLSVVVQGINMDCEGNPMGTWHASADYARGTWLSGVANGGTYVLRNTPANRVDFTGW